METRAKKQRLGSRLGAIRSRVPDAVWPFGIDSARVTSIRAPSTVARRLILQ